MTGFFKCICVVLVGLVSGIFFPQGAAADVPIVFDLQGRDPSKVWVQFTGGAITGTYRDGNGNQLDLKNETAYSMAEITSPVSVGGKAPANMPAILVSTFSSGRMYVNFGDTGLQGLKPGYQPNALNDNDKTGNYYRRWQYVEPTILSDEFNINVTYIDFVSISWSIEAKNAPVGTNDLITHADAQTLVDVGGSAASPADSNMVPPGKKLPDPAFARALGSNLAPAGEYHDWKNYLQTTLQGKTVHIAGVFQGVGDQPTPGNKLTQAQTYDFDVTFNSAGDAIMAARTGSGNGQANSVTAAYRGTGIGDNVQLHITYDELNKTTGIYGNNPAYTYWIDGIKTSTTGIINDVIGWIVGDLMAGLSFGCPGSTVLFNGKPIGDHYSSEWWGNSYNPYEDYTKNFIDPKDTPTGQGLIFDKAQPGQPDNYDNWSAKVHVLGNGYTTPFQDRLGKVLMTVKPLSASPDFYALITINPDDDGTSYTVTPSAGPNGTIAPNTPQSVEKGMTAQFTVTPNAGYTASVAGTCGGQLVGNTYTTGPITANCTVNATFTATTQHTVTATAGANGTISPNTRTVNDGEKTSFTVTPNNGYAIDTVTGCSGTLTRNTYTTGAITADCAVNATFKALTPHTVTPSAGANGTISPSTPQTVYDGQTGEFTVTPNAGYAAAVAGTCGGSLVGNTYTTSPVTADCTVDATFTVLIPHTVTPSAGPNGTINPSTPQIVYDGRTTQFTVTPNTGYGATVAGTCGGRLSSNTYTTSAITADCSVNATFTLHSYTVYGTAGAGGTINPATRTVNYGDTTTFTVTPNDGYRIASVTGCNGTLVGNTYTTGPITGGCNVVATFTSTANDIPTLSEWGMMIMFMLMVATAGVTMYRRRKHGLS